MSPTFLLWAINDTVEPETLAPKWLPIWDGGVTSPWQPGQALRVSSVCTNKARGQSSPHLVTSQWNWSVVVEIGFRQHPDAEDILCLEWLTRWLTTSDRTVWLYSHKGVATQLGWCSVYFGCFGVWKRACGCSYVRIHFPVHSNRNVVLDFWTVRVMLSQSRCLSRGLCFQGRESVKERSCQHACAAGIQHEQGRPPMSNVTALISFQCSPGITAGARDRHTSLLHRMRFPGGSAIHKSTGVIWIKSIASCQYCFVLSCVLILGISGSRCNAAIFQFLFSPVLLHSLWSLECDALHDYKVC